MYIHEAILKTGPQIKFAKWLLCSGMKKERDLPGGRRLKNAKIQIAGKSKNDTRSQRDLKHLGEKFYKSQLDKIIKRGSEIGSRSRRK